MASADRIACLFFPGSIPEKRFLAWVEACGRFTPQIALRGNQAIFLDITRCASLYTEDGFRARVGALARRIFPDTVPKIAIAESAPTALAFARSGLVDRLRLDLEALQDYLNPFSQEATPALRSELGPMISLMRTLGLKNLGDFLALPPASLASRFGRKALEVAAYARGDLPVAWPGYHPIERVVERAGQGGENIEALIFVLRALVDRAMARLRGRSERATVVQLTLELEKWSTVGPDLRASVRLFRVEFPVPQGGASGILSVLHEQLASALAREPLSAPVDALGFEVLETVPGRGAQKDFFSQKEEQDEAFEALIARLSQKLGVENIFSAIPVSRHLPEGAYLRSMQSPSSSSPVGLASHQGGSVLEDLPPRPTRLLSCPERILVHGKRILRANGQNYLARSWRGPERISGEWWKQGLDRDYFEVIADSGEKLWIFKKSGNEVPRDSQNSFFLHGFFD